MSGRYGAGDSRRATAPHSVCFLFFQFLEDVMKKIYTVIFLLLPAVLFFASSVWAAIQVISVRPGFVSPVHETGQQRCTTYNLLQLPLPGWEWDADCTDPDSPAGQDGEKRPGMSWPDPRFTDGNDGTVIDNMTGLVWLKTGGCTTFFEQDITGNRRTWSEAMTAVQQLASGYCGLTDGSQAQDWRLPTINELLSLVHRDYVSPAISNAAGTGQWSTGDPFSTVWSVLYWTSTTTARDPGYAWTVNFNYGNSWSFSKAEQHYIWPVRSGK